MKQENDSVMNNPPSGGGPHIRRKPSRDGLSGPWALQDIPPAPWVTIKLLQTLSLPIEEVQMDRVVDMIGGDGSLSSELLRRANSAMYGLPSQVSSLHHAAVIMGLASVRTLALTLGLRAYLHTPVRARRNASLLAPQPWQCLLGRGTLPRLPDSARQGLHRRSAA